MRQEQQRIRRATFWDQRVAATLIKGEISELYRLKKTVRGSRNIESCLATMERPSAEASCMNGQDLCRLHSQMALTATLQHLCNITRMQYKDEKIGNKTEMQI
jgi:hypothetical protein